MDGEVIKWQGIGRWLCLTVAGILVALSTPLVFSQVLGPAAGWNIFLGLLLFGAIVSGSPKAPLLTAILSALMFVRIIVGLATHPSVVDFGVNALLIAVLMIARRDLKRQRR